MRVHRWLNPSVIAVAAVPIGVLGLYGPAVASRSWARSAACIGILVLVASLVGLRRNSPVAPTLILGSAAGGIYGAFAGVAPRFRMTFALLSCDLSPPGALLLSVLVGIAFGFIGAALCLVPLTRVRIGPDAHDKAPRALVSIGVWLVIAGALGLMQATVEARPSNVLRSIPTASWISMAAGISCFLAGCRWFRTRLELLRLVRGHHAPGWRLRSPLPRENTAGLPFWLTPSAGTKAAPRPDVLESELPCSGPPYRSAPTWQAVALVCAFPETLRSELRLPFRNRVVARSAVAAAVLLEITRAEVQVRRYLVDSEIEQAKEGVAALARAAVVAYNGDGVLRCCLSPHPCTLPPHELCASSTRVPSQIPRGRRHAAGERDFSTGDRTAGWQCLKFRISEPTFYSYQYTASVEEGTFVVEAWGDLDGDGIPSHFSRSGGRTRDGEMLVARDIVAENPEE
jgi:hypothetical protein